MTPDQHFISNILWSESASMLIAVDEKPIEAWEHSIESCAQCMSPFFGATFYEGNELYFFLFFFVCVFFVLLYTSSVLPLTHKELKELNCAMNA
jgi:hypothetical protein